MRRAWRCGVQALLFPGRWKVIAYASNTGTRRNLFRLRQANWRILLTPSNPKRPSDFRYAIDNGAWTCFMQNEPFNDKKFMRLVEANSADADFVVLPDIVQGGMESFDLSTVWLRKLRGLHLLFPVQDGMNVDAVESMLKTHRDIGLFLGGSTEYKLAMMPFWGAMAARLGRWLHVGRVNTVRRIRLCAEAGVTSFDGTSATMFSCNVDKLENARRQPSLLAPARAQ